MIMMMIHCCGMTPNYDTARLLCVIVAISYDNNIRIVRIIPS